MYEESGSRRQAAAAEAVAHPVVLCRRWFKHLKSLAINASISEINKIEMKPHLIIKFKSDAQAVEAADAASWMEIIKNKKGAATKIHPALDALFDKYRLPVWVAKEYKPKGDDWSPAEIESGLNRVYRLILQNDTLIPDALLREISMVPVVEYVHVGRLAHSDLPPVMPAQMSATTNLDAREAIYLDEAQTYTKGDPAITVAVLDTGVGLDHPELKDAIRSGYDFVDILDGAEKFIGDYLGADPFAQDEVGHGTHVAGIIAARGQMMPMGVAPRCKLLAVRVLAAMERGGKRVGAGLIDNINAGVKWAIDQGADVINMSLGIRHTGGGLPHQEVVDYARRKGVTIVAAAGNDGREQLYYPGALPHVIAVGAFDETGEIATFSTYGPQVSFIAPGSNIYSSYLDNDYAFSSGTSQAAPFVTGAVAMLKSYARSKGARLSDRQVKNILKHTADKEGREFKNRKAGFGKLNLIDALRLLEYRLN